MADDYVIGIGTVGAGLWMGYGAGEKWRHVQHGPPVEGNCRVVLVDPHRPGDSGRRPIGSGCSAPTDCGGRWERVGPDVDAADLVDVLRPARRPADLPRHVAGHRAVDGRRRDVRAAGHLDQRGPARSARRARPTSSSIRSDPAVVWASVEVDGLHRSDDRGDTWTSLGQLGPDEFHNDVHGLHGAADRRRQRARRDDAVRARSIDATGAPRSSGTSSTRSPGRSSAFAYSPLRAGALDDDVIVVCVGDYVPGRIGALEISRDGGASWTREPLPVTPNSTMYWLATHPRAAGHDRRHLAVRAGVRVRRPRRHVAQARPRVRRDPRRVAGPGRLRCDAAGCRVSDRPAAGRTGRRGSA